MADESGVRDMLRHTLATLSYRAAKTFREAPDEFAGFRIGETSRTPGEILAHMGDLLDWALWMTRGEHRWREADPLPWKQEVDRFFAAVERLDEALANSEGEGFPSQKIFQGPIADALNHVGQLAMLRRLAGAPIRGENFFKADIRAGRVGPEQDPPRREFD
jgi:hypothetical protein